jgi:hypothetical protein
MVRHAGAAPAPAVWKTAVLAVTPMTRMKMVAASGIAPRSLAYRARALLLSYGGMKNGRPTR